MYSMQKRIIQSQVLFVSLSVVSLNVFAVSNGFYFGVMAGPTKSDTKTINVQVKNPGSITDTTPAVPKKNQVGARIFVGNQIVPYAAIEGGFDIFAPITYTTKVDTCTS